MGSNRVSVSGDRMEMTIRSSAGQRATLRSQRPGGFTPHDVDNARDYHFHTGVPHQINRTWRRAIGRRVVYLHLNLGPPTWWLPRIQLRHKVAAGWLRALVALSWDGPASGGTHEQ